MRNTAVMCRSRSRVLACSTSSGLRRDMMASGPISDRDRSLRLRSSPSAGGFAATRCRGLASPKESPALNKWGAAPSPRVHWREPSPWGFTLIELLLVLVILTALTALVVPRFTGRTQRARITAARTDILLNIATALDMYEMDTGRYPTTEQGLGALLECPQLSPVPENWIGPYLKRPVMPVDPWGKEYGYRCPPSIRGVDYELFSSGPDGIVATSDDITNWGE